MPQCGQGDFCQDFDPRRHAANQQEIAMSRTDPQNNQPRGPTQEEISAFELGRAIGRREGILRPCVPSGDACGAEGGDRPPAASVHDGQPGRQPL